jgi:hypothetical protein
MENQRSGRSRHLHEWPAPRGPATDSWHARRDLLRASKTHWHMTGRLEAYEGDVLIFSRDRDKKIRRKLV